MLVGLSAKLRRQVHVYWSRLVGRHALLPVSALMGTQVYLLVSQPRPVGLVSQSAQAGRQVRWSVSQP